jgi:PAS domain-containing protein
MPAFTSTGACTIVGITAATGNALAAATLAGTGKMPTRSRRDKPGPRACRRAERGGRCPPVHHHPIVQDTMRASLVILPPMLLVALPAGAQGNSALPALIGPGTVAAVALAALAAVGLMIVRMLRAERRLAEAEATRARLDAENRALRATAERAESQARLLDNVISALPSGVAVVDAELRIVTWNPRFPDVTGVPRAALRIGMPFEEAVLLQARAGEFGLVDPEAETARRMALLREGHILERWERQRPDGSRIELRRAPLPGGGFVTLYTRRNDVAPIMHPDLVQAFRADWSARLPRLTAAAADGDMPAVRVTAHALRGIAGNAGWGGAVATLAALEAAAAAPEPREVRALAASLMMDEPW